MSSGFDPRYRSSWPSRAGCPGAISGRICSRRSSAAVRDARFTGILELPLLQLAAKARTGPAQWFAEFVATFGLLVTILAVVRFWVRRSPTRLVYITAAYWFTASTWFANPAVTIARG